MEYKINGEIINIPTEEKSYGHGSEGNVYKIGNEIYKIYYPNMINEGYGNKGNFHNRLLYIPTKQIVLPNAIIEDLENNYVGYKTIFINGNTKNKTGITKMPSKKFIKNLHILEQDFSLLTKNYILAADVSPINYIYDQSQIKMYAIDPGRYRSHPSNSQISCEIQNTAQLNNWIETLLEIDFITYKPVNSKRKAQQLKRKIKELHKSEPYSNFFERELRNYEYVHDYAKSLEKYIK